MATVETLRTQHRARGRANRALSRRFPERYRELHRQAVKDAGLPPVSEPRERAKARNRLRSQTLRRLAHEYPDDFRDLYREALAAEGLPLPRTRRRVAACGTPPGYQRHKRLGEDPCEDCLTANFGEVYQQYQDTRKARQKVVTVLTHQHRDRFRELLAQERAGLPSGELSDSEQKRVRIRVWRAARKRLVAELPKQFEQLLADQQRAGSP